MTGIGDTAAEALITRGKSVGIGPVTLAQTLGVDSRDDIAHAADDQIAPVEALIIERTQLLERVVAAMRKNQVSSPETYWDAYKRKYKDTEALKRAVEALEASR